MQDQLLGSLEADVYFDGDEIQLKLQKALATLPEKQQLVFNMKYFQELKYEEISEILETWLVTWKFLISSQSYGQRDAWLNQSLILKNEVNVAFAEQPECENDYIFG